MRYREVDLWQPGALESTRRLAGLLAAKGIRHELAVWGDDVPHDWRHGVPMGLPPA